MLKVDFVEGLPVLNALKNKLIKIEYVTFVSLVIKIHLYFAKSFIRKTLIV